MTYDEALQYLSKLGRFGINLGLKRIERLVELMGYPQKSYQTVHVTGTNGKGSTTAMLSAILTASGIRTGMYISPHLLDYTERICINDKPISREEFAEAIAYTEAFVQRMIDEGWEHPTEFEVLTAAAFYHFAKAGVEYAVIEVGLGGLLDSTNVITPSVAVITNVALEHTDRCGDTVTEVASHKAGIIKPATSVVTAATGEALLVIGDVAKQQGAELFVLGEDFTAEGEMTATFASQTVTLRMKDQVCFGPTPISLKGRNQIVNSACAIMAVMILGRDDQRINSGTIATGLAQVAWPGRFEVFDNQPTVIIDGAHNPHGAKALRENLDLYYPGKAITFLIGILKDKDVAGIIQTLIRNGDTVIVTAPMSDRADDPECIAQQIANATAVHVSADIADGIRLARQLAGEYGTVCICGSLYLIGEARRLIVNL